MEENDYDKMGVSPDDAHKAEGCIWITIVSGITFVVILLCEVAR